jgi:general secretion pathway protein I
VTQRPLPKVTGGFTLIELTIVIFVIAIVSAITVPRLRGLAAVELSATTRRLSNTTRFLFEEAAFQSTTYALNLDIGNQAYWVTRFDRESGEFVEDPSILTRRVALPRDIRMVDVVLPAYGKLDGGIAIAFFYPEGFADPAVIHLIDTHDTDRAAGFTLLEVMIALGVLATALVALISLHGRNIRVVAYDQQLNRATLLAQEVMTRMLVETPFPDPSEESGTFENDRAFSWNVRVLRGPSEELEETLREIQVRVFWDANDPDAALLITHVRKPDK